MSKHRHKHESTRRPKATGVAPSSYGLLALAALVAVTVAAAVRLSLLQGHGGPAAGGAAQRPRGADVSCTDGACASRAGGTLFPELGDSDVAVQSSSLPAAGKGAFALREFGPGEHVGTYRCEPKLNKRLKGEGDYDWELNSTTSCDGLSYLNRNPMRYVNSIAALDTCRMENVQVVIGATVSYVATRLIRSGEELLVDYGAAYFKLRPNMLAVGARYECDASPLHLASMRGDEGAVRAQLEGLDKGAAGGLVNMRASSQQLRWTPLMEAAAVGAGDVARLLLQHGARVNSIALDDARPYSALYIASHNGKSEIVSALIQAGARVNQAAGNHGTPLVAASRKGHAEVAKLLLNAGAEVDRVSSDGESPLIIASNNGHKDVVRVLLKVGGARVDQETHGTTPLFVAIQEGHANVVEVLLNEGIEVGARVVDIARNGVTPLILASNRGNAEVVTMLLKAGATVSGVGDGGVTPLIVASVLGHTEIVRLLLQNGAPTDQAMSNGGTPLLAARQKGHAEIAKILTQHGAVQ